MQQSDCRVNRGRAGPEQWRRSPISAPVYPAEIGSLQRQQDLGEAVSVKLPVCGYRWRWPQPLAGAERAGMVRPAVIFDFDGTLCDTLGPSLEVLNRLAPRYRYRPVHDGEIETLRAMTTRQILRHLGIGWYQIPSILRDARAEMHAAIAGCSACPGVAALLRELDRRGITLGIVTSNSEHNARAFLVREQIPCHHLHAGSSLFGKHRALRRMVRNHGLDPGRVLYVGDEVRDIEAARRAGVRSVAVTWGFAQAELLRRHGPDHVVTEAWQILDLLDAADG